jgi:hypothetical protein
MQYHMRSTSGSCTTRRKSTCILSVRNNICRSCGVKNDGVQPMIASLCMSHVKYVDTSANVPRSKKGTCPTCTCGKAVASSFGAPLS